jgi:PHD/YefM family antitoxin component YafN of YafNO toxin-antitoxin module
MVETSSDARADLSSPLARFRVDSEPVVFGEHGRREAVLLSFATFELLCDVAEELVITDRIRERSAADSGDQTALADVACEFGVDLDEL